MLPPPPSPSTPPGLASCTDCELGYFLAETSSSASCKACPKGTFAGSKGSNKCTDCPAGRYGDQRAESRGQPDSECAGSCAAGRYGKARDVDALCSGPCPKGRFSAEGARGLDGCSPCPAGRYGTEEGEYDPQCYADCQGTSEGASCCPTVDGSCDSIPSPMPAPAPAPSTSSKDVGTLPSPSSSDSSSSSSSSASSTSETGIYVGVAIVALLLGTCTYFALQKNRDKEKKLNRSSVVATGTLEKGKEQGKEIQEEEDESMSSKDESAPAPTVPAIGNVMSPGGFGQQTRYVFASLYSHFLPSFLFHSYKFGQQSIGTNPLEGSWES